MNEPRHPADAMLEDWHLHEPRTRPTVSPGLRRLVWLFAAAVAVAVAVGVSGYL